MLYFIAHGDCPQDLLDTFNNEGYHLSPFTVNREMRGELYDVPNIYEWRAEENVSLYDIQQDGIQGLRIANEGAARIPPIEFAPEEDDENDVDDGDDEDDEDDELYEALQETVAAVPPSSQEDRVSGTPFTVRKMSWSGGDYNDKYRPLFVDFARKMQRNLNIAAPHNVSVGLHSDDAERFWINVWSTPDPQATRSVEHGDRILGIRNRMHDRGFPAVTPEQFPTLIDTLMDGDRPVAQLFDNDLYFLHDSVHFSDDNTLAIVKAILDWATEAYNITPEERQARLEQHRREAAERARRAYVGWVANRSEATLRTLRQQFDRAQQRSEAARTAHIEAIRNETNVGAQLRIAERGSDVDPGRYGQEYDKLMESPKIKAIDFDPAEQLFTVHTEKLFVVRENGERREMGEFRITLNRQGQLLFFNKTRQVNGYKAGMHHPHVFAHGGACLGNFSEIVAPLAAQFEYGSLMLMAISFLESVNERDAAGAHVAKWPLAIDEKEAAAIPEVTA